MYIGLVMILCMQMDMDTNMKLLEELMAREKLAGDVEAKVEEARTNCINAVNEERERPNSTGTATETINAAAGERNTLELQLKVIVPTKPDEGQIEMRFV